MGPISLHVIFDLPQIQVRFPRFAEDASDAGRTSLGHLDENALVLVRDHVGALAYLILLIAFRACEKWVGRDSNPEPTP